ncbi:hypothetical protein CLAIMM_00250 [Cladophialophora immunda]|nr:hypothetical protein CLAIMM_00250 [Cladophialophora immunda]
MADPTDTQHVGKRNTSVWANIRFIWFTILVGFSLLEYGFDNGEIGGFQAMVGFLQVFGYEDPRVPTGWNIRPVPQQIISSFMLLGSFIASCCTGLIGTYLGRRHSLMVGCALLIVGVTIQIVTTSMGALYFARLITGLSNGILMSFTFLYVVEMAPPYFRGLGYAFCSCWVTLGTAIGYVITNSTEKIHNRHAYQIPLYTLYAIPVIIFGSLPFLPESPRWLLLHGKNEQALKSITWMRNGAYDELALRQEYEEMKLNAMHEIENQSSILLFDMLRSRNIRRSLISCGIGLINPAMGGMFVMAFATYFFTVVGVESPFRWIIMCQFLGVLGQCTSYFFIDRVGRRTMLLIGTTICAISMLLLGIVSTPSSVRYSKAYGKVVIFLFSFYLWGFNFGVTSMTYLVAGEIPAQNLRAYTSGISTGSGFVFAWLTAFTAPYFINPSELNWGGKYGYIWFGSCVVAIVFVYLFVPEVRGRTLEEIEEMFDKGISARDFSTYVCDNVIIAREQAEEVVYGEKKPERVQVVHIEAADSV